MAPQLTPFITPDALLAHWQGHRRLTRKLIAVFPEDRLFTFSLGGMRPFGEFAMVRGAVSGNWEMPSRDQKSKAEILRLWDESTEQLNTLWPQLPPERFRESMTAFERYPGILHDLILYVIDNEVHHRGQGYVYLRALGIEPPLFFDRS
jgi:uncharacterized damage-inducible protein DinB